MELVEGIDGMFLEPLGNRQWQLTWDVPQEMDAMIEVELKATDGQTSMANGNPMEVKRSSGIA